MKAFLFDRDGTLIVNKHYLSSPTGIRFTPCAIETLKFLTSRGFKLFIVTNQSGVKKGYYSIDRLESIHRELLLRLKIEKINVTDVLYCFHHPNERCNCRKPGNYFLKWIIRKYGIVPKYSFFVGDRQEDVEFGMKSGLKTILIKNNPNKNFIASADYIVESLCEIPGILNENST